ncbi:hypothetical protein O181_048052 [Austropuccinia psidii MF-1]|uniref:Uncharacterized protein n=1 Tax=Austropuccinia psidii MF-1 TaxID=1389203 RepID=A0A9Q3DZ34_9BASI|nr:hypothetical protein [Austropuccinia psidii MF-1]
MPSIRPVRMIIRLDRSIHYDHPKLNQSHKKDHDHPFIPSNPSDPPNPNHHHHNHHHHRLDRIRHHQGAFINPSNQSSHPQNVQPNNQFYQPQRNPNQYHPQFVNAPTHAFNNQSYHQNRNPMFNYPNQPPLKAPLPYSQPKSYPQPTGYSHSNQSFHPQSNHPRFPSSFPQQYPQSYRPHIPSHPTPQPQPYLTPQPNKPNLPYSAPYPSTPPPFNLPPNPSATHYSSHPFQPPPSRAPTFPVPPISPHAHPSRPIAPHQRRASHPAQAFGFDFQDLSGLEMLDQATQNPTSPNSPQPTKPFNPSSQAIAHRLPLGDRSWANEGYRPLTKHPNLPTASHLNQATSNWPNRPARSTGMRQGTGDGLSASRSRSAPPRFGQRPRARINAQSSPPEPSLPAPPTTVLDAQGKFGIDPSPLGCPENTPRALSSEPSLKPTESPSAISKSEYNSIQHLISNSQGSINLPGLTKPIAFEAQSNKHWDPNQLEIDWKHGQADREQIVGKALNIVIQNPTMEIKQKREVVALVDFLLMSKEERMLKMQK